MREITQIRQNDSDFRGARPSVSLRLPSQYYATEDVFGVLLLLRVHDGDRERGRTRRQQQCFRDSDRESQLGGHAASSTSRNVQLPARNWHDYWTNTKYIGGQNLVWSNPDTSKMPIFVREGSIIPLLARVPQTLCNANYVNNPSIITIDSALQFLVYPGPSAASFNVYDGTTAQVSVSGSSTTLTLSSISRLVSWKIFAATAPAGAERDVTSAAPDDAK